MPPDLVQARAEAADANRPERRTGTRSCQCLVAGYVASTSPLMVRIDSVTEPVQWAPAGWTPTVGARVAVGWVGDLRAVLAELVTA